MNKAKVAPPSSHLRFDRKNAAIGFFVLAILLSAGIWWVGQKDDVRPQSERNKPSKVISDALNTKDGASQAELEAALKNSPTKQEKIQLLQLLAVEAQKKNDLETALDYMKQTYDAGLKDPNLTMNIGMLYLEKMHDKPQALKYLKLSLSDAQSGGAEAAMSENLKTFLTGKIKELEDQGVKAAK